MLAPAPTMLRLGTGTLLGLNRPAGSSGAGMLPESSDNETAPRYPPNIPGVNSPYGSHGR